MIRYKCVVMYDGTNFHGFQVQDELRTVQLEIENVLKIICKKEIRIYPAGRTDTGVHALGQVFHFDTEIDMPNWNMKNAINSRLPRDIHILSAEHVDMDFHARFSVHSKEYKYLIDIGEYNPLNGNYRYYYRHKLNLNKMIEASKVFVGEHDFKSFTKNHELENTVRNIYSIDFDVKDTLITITFKGNGFMHNMVRIIVAMMIEVSNDRMTINRLKEIMEAKNRLLAPKIAPPNGLYLVSINYK